MYIYSQTPVNAVVLKWHRLTAEQDSLKAYHYAVAEKEIRAVASFTLSRHTSSAGIGLMHMTIQAHGAHESTRT